SLVPEQHWQAEGGEIILKAGASLYDSNRASAAFSPIAELSRTWASGALRRVYASYTTTTELPSYTALDSSTTSGLFFGNPDLGRETSRQTDLGASGSLWGWTGEAAVFYRRDDNLVDWTYTDGVFGRSANAVNIGTEGLELSARRSWGLVSVVVGYTALAKSADYLQPGITASFYALNYARQRLTAALTLQLTRTLELRVDNAARIQEPDSLRTQGGNDAFISSAGLYWQPSSMRRLEFSLLVDNLWNSAFQAVPGVPASRRQLSFGATYGW
ncbi:MAG TPA: TonB-dependent receptor, partial [Opitutaceae bacterium]